MAARNQYVIVRNDLLIDPVTGIPLRSPDMADVERRHQRERAELERSISRSA